jgi:uncharacterized membrane protein
MALGYSLGPVMAWPPAGRRRFLLAVGAAAAVGFLALRAANVYGDPVRWSEWDDGWRTAASFLNCRKYPPSLLYLVMTLGPALALLGLIADRPVPAALRPAVVFGRVPLFYYLLHLPLIHGAAVLVAVLRYGPAVLESRRPPDDWGFGLPVVYAVWIAAVFLLYWPCRWFAEVKRRSRSAWLGYL